MERRSSKEWAEIGTVEETVKMVKFQERKQMNTAVIYGVYGLGMLVAFIATEKKNRENERREKERWIRKAKRDKKLVEFDNMVDYTRA